MLSSEGAAATGACSNVRTGAGVHRQMYSVLFSSLHNIPIIALYAFLAMG